MDISAEVTDVVTVFKGTVIDATSFPIGKHFVIREVAHRLDTVPEEAASTLRTFMEGNSSVGQLEKLNKVLDDVKQVWLDSFQETLGRMAREAPIAKDVYLAVDRDYGEWFSRVIASGNYSAYTLAKSPFKITTLGEKVLKRHCDFNKMTAPFDAHLAIQALFMHKKLYR
jgi:hypothetical protein